MNLSKIYEISYINWEEKGKALFVFCVSVNISLKIIKRKIIPLHATALCE